MAVYFASAPPNLSSAGDQWIDSRAATFGIVSVFDGFVWKESTAIAAASTLTGTTLASNVVTSSITSVGILASPHMTGAVVDSGGLTVTAGGVAVTGNVTISTGDLQFGATSDQSNSVYSNVSGRTMAITTNAGLLNFGTATSGVDWTIGTSHGLYSASATGGDKGAGTINVTTNVFLNGTAYTNPHGGFEAAFTGKVEKFADRMKAMGMPDWRHLSLTEMEGYVREYMHFPGFADEDERGLFDGGERVLLMLEWLTCHVFELAKR